ncbi:hypothetical protein BD626DRAFT_500634 [Schizophyllum amplum]|uniref:Transmembrane protein n=1 Tax=Schizophyllum amplum TaxID=97359 RepID=A0A550CAJ1_9AGAR|nr:hypothetical protein BD626DRAFT_500634 [Auriculariopsis ampla]
MRSSEALVALAGILFLVIFVVFVGMCVGLVGSVIVPVFFIHGLGVLSSAGERGLRRLARIEVSL